LAYFGVCLFRIWRGRSNSSGASDNSVSFTCFLLFCKRVEEISSVVSIYKVISKTFGRVRERTHDAFKDEGMYFAPCVGDAYLCHGSDGKCLWTNVSYFFDSV
jgi:hypothetical protein